MALVKTSQIARLRKAAPEIRSEKAGATVAGSALRASRTASGAAPDKLSERIAVATEELVGGLTEAAGAGEELRRAMEQIAASAEEASAASQEQVAAIKNMLTNLAAGSVQAEAGRRRTESLQAVLAETAALITSSVGAVERNAGRYLDTVRTISEFDHRAADVEEVTRIVSQIADQTNLLALNAAIEAARAGEHGRGFAVVADEVRALAERSDNSAKQAQALAAGIQSTVRAVVERVKAAAETAGREAKAGAQVVTTLDAMRGDMERISVGSQDTLAATKEAERAAAEAHRGAERVASASEQQASAASQAQTAIRQQVESLEQGQIAAQALAKLTDMRKTDTSASQQTGAMAEQLSATVQELSSAASQIMSAVEQISRGAEHQAAATEQSSAALAQIEKSARLAQANATTAVERVQLMQTALRESRTAIEGLIAGIAGALDGGKLDVSTSENLEAQARNIEKVVDAIALIVVQTNMLAVSGAVESARAGSSGRGFAVVSNDIRNLARDASESVERMKDTARAILYQIGSLRRELENIIAGLDAEIKNNRAIFATLEKITSEFAALNASNQSILHGAEAILASAVEATTGARQIATAAEETSAAAREASAASNQQASGAENLAAAIEEIAQLANEMSNQNA